MTPEMLYVGLSILGTIAGYAIRHFQGKAGTPALPAPSTPSPGGSSAPAVPGRISIGHGELLSLLLTAFNSPPPASGMPSIPTPAVSHPSGPPAAQIDVNGLLNALLARLAVPTPPGPIAATSQPTPAKA